MAARFYCSQIGDETARLDDSESHHALHVMRLKVGDDLELFDGQGRVCHGNIADADRRQVSVAVSRIVDSARPNRPRLVVAAAPPRGDRLKSMVEKLTELGVDEFIPLRTVRSVVDPRQSRLEKLRSTVIGAMKQSGRNHLMQICEPCEFSVALRNATAAGQSVWIAHPGEAAGNAVETVQRDALLLIGPEGGFTNEEVLQATDYDAERLSWPEGILRIETASVLFAGLLLQRM